MDKDQKIVLQYLKKHRDVFTLADASASTGLALLETKYALKSLMNTYHCRLAASDNGDVLYLFGNQLVRRDAKSMKERIADFKEMLWNIFKAVYKVCIAVVLVVYFVVFLVILVAMLLGLMSQGKDSKSSGRGSAGVGRLVSEIFYSIFRFNTHHRTTYRPRDPWGYPYNHYEPKETHMPTWRKKPKDIHDKKNRVDSKSFISSVYDFVFGPPRIEIDPLTNHQEVAAYLRENNGVITPAEVQALAGWTRNDAEDFMTTCLAEFNGDASISENAVLYGEFDDLMRTAESKDKNASTEIVHFWDEYEAEHELTGNNKSRDVAIVGMNGFNLFFSGAIINGQLFASGIPADFMWAFGLGWFPFLYSVVFFAVPLFRMPGVKKRQKQQHIQNIRKRLMKVIYENHRDEIPVSLLTETANAWRTTEETLNPKVVDNVMMDFIQDLAGDGRVNDEGTIVYHFERLNRELTDVDDLRDKRIATGNRSSGYIDL